MYVSYYMSHKSAAWYSVMFMTSSCNIIHQNDALHKYIATVWKSKFVSNVSDALKLLLNSLLFETVSQQAGKQSSQIQLTE